MGDGKRMVLLDEVALCRGAKLRFGTPVAEECQAVAWHSAASFGGAGAILGMARRRGYGSRRVSNYGLTLQVGEECQAVAWHSAASFGGAGEIFNTARRHGYGVRRVSNYGLTLQ